MLPYAETTSMGIDALSLVQSNNSNNPSSSAAGLAAAPTGPGPRSIMKMSQVPAAVQKRIASLDDDPQGDTLTLEDIFGQVDSMKGAGLV